MSTLRRKRDNRRTKGPRGTRSVRWRLSAAMLALALVPTMAGIYLTTSLVRAPDATLTTQHSRATSESAAALLSREQAIEARLLRAAGDPEMARLVNGIDGSSERQLATRALRTLQGEDGVVVADACIVRVADGTRAPFTANRTDACADGSLQRRAIAIGDSVTRTTSGEGAAQRLLIATPLHSVNARNRAVLTAEVDVASLFDRTHMLGGDTVSSMLVDMGSSEVVAAAAASAGPVDGADPVDPAAALPYISGVVSHSEEADAELLAMGLASSVVPLWSNGDGTHHGPGPALAGHLG